jgi:hypothetical protein
VSGHWIDEWDLSLEDVPFRAKRAKRRHSHRDYGTEEYLVSVTDTSAAARRRFSPYAVAPTWVRT